MSRPLSPKNLAASLGVSESSVKRWIDEGKLRAARTPKGHRRIELDDALRFVRSTKLSLERPDEIGIAAVRIAALAKTGSEFTELLHSALSEGRGEDVMGLTLGRFLAGDSLASLCDGPIRISMERIGELWHGDPSGVFIEHRATVLCLDTLRSIHRLLEIPADAPVVLAAAPSDDYSSIPTMAITAVLSAEGFRVVNLGAHTPLGALLSAIQWHSPFLVCISASHCENHKRLSEELDKLAKTLASRNAHLAVGGLESAGLQIPKSKNVFHSDRLGDLVGYCRGLTSATMPRGA